MQGLLLKSEDMNLIVSETKTIKTDVHRPAAFSYPMYLLNGHNSSGEY